VPTTTLRSTDHRHLTRDECRQALALVRTVVKFINGPVPLKVEQALKNVGLFLQRYGKANNCFRKQRSHDVRQNLIAIADREGTDCEDGEPTRGHCDVPCLTQRLYGIASKR